ncbi:hypothetical protein [Conexibacter arvalis]|uniref:Uncharacterized protein n=1 Tax=Conexibacter arvalis TaxID=912552 RepID=A0A840I7D6_9ACTN|nr:hypothetical protein [Conexibacter arvalis]MBB4660799.1 hypothetical protein [Conexibacter arvalis]
MRGRSLRGPTVALAAALAVAAVFAAAPADAARLTAGLGPSARLGQPSPIRLGLEIDDRPATLKRIELKFPDGFGISTSGLGIAACRPPAAVIRAIVLPNTGGLGGCSPNAVIGFGSALADVRIDTMTIPELADVTVLTGSVSGARKLRLIYYIDGRHPFGARLVFAGTLAQARPPWGGSISLVVPSIPTLPSGATLALRRIRVSIGENVTYRERRGRRRVAYRPRAVAVPATCPRRGFRFQARLVFADGYRTSSDAVVPCPRRAMAPRTRG